MIEDVEVLFDELDPFAAENFFSITLKDGQELLISTSAIKDKTPVESIERFGYGFHKKFFWFFFDTTYMQSGVLMIMDVKKNEWIFSEYDEGLCVIEFSYGPQKDSFSGCAAYDLPMSEKPVTYGQFSINSDGYLSWLK